MEVDKDLPSHVKYWLTATSKIDCFFVLGSKSGTTERIGAIKVVLFAHSEALRNMLEDSELAEQGDVRVVDIEPGTFRTFLKCIYGGSDILIPKLSFKESVELMYVTEKYLVTEIKHKVVTHILQLLPLSFDNIFCALSNPVCFTDKTLEASIMIIVKRDVGKMFASDKFMLLTADALLIIVKSDSLNTSEPNIWEAAMKWAKHTTSSSRGEVLRKQMLSHLNFIRFCTFSCEEFCEKVVPTGVLTCEEVNEVCKYFGTGHAPKLEYVCKSTDPRHKTEDGALKSFFHVVKGIINLLSDRETPTVTFRKYSWNLKLEKNSDDTVGECLGIFLKCGGHPDNSSWNIRLTAKLVLVNQQDKPNFSKLITHTFCRNQTDWGFRSFYFWDQLMDVSNGFVKNNSIIVMVHLKLVSD